MKDATTPMGSDPGDPWSDRPFPYWPKGTYMSFQLRNWKPWGEGGGNVALGPFQVNWYGEGWRVHVTWPVLRTFEFRRGRKI